MQKKLQRRVWVEVDLGRLRENYRRIAGAVKPAKVLCVLKANAYGLGVDRYAAALAETDCVPEKKVKRYIDEVLADYDEKVSGAKRRLERALEIIIVAYYASLMKQRADAMLEALM